MGLSEDVSPVDRMGYTVIEQTYVDICGYAGYTSPLHMSNGGWG